MKSNFTSKIDKYATIINKQSKWYVKSYVNNHIAWKIPFTPTKIIDSMVIKKYYVKICNP